jgi:F420-dependent oxidoreductase-like protein
VRAFRRALHFGSITAFSGSSKELYSTVSDIALAAERAGFDALFVPDHLHQGPIGGGPSEPIFEAWTLLGALAACTTTARIGALVSPVTTRNPALLTKTVTSLDVISGGRAILGYGAGWDADEHAAYGVDFPAVGDRMARLDEALQIAKLLLREPRPTFSGRVFSISAPFNVPGPIGRVPILVGGGGEKRTLRLVAEHADVCNISGDREELIRKFAVLDAHCEAVGRDPAEIQRTVALRQNAGNVEELQRLVETALSAGAEGIVCLAPVEVSTVEAWGETLMELIP